MLANHGRRVKPPTVPRRGEVWWVRHDPTLGSEIDMTRPFVIVTGDIFNARRRTVVVVPLSSSPPASPPLLVPVLCAGQPVVAVIDQVRAIAKERLHERLDVLSQADMDAVADGIREVLELG